MTISALQHFPDVCRLCLHHKPAPEMVPLGSTPPEYDAQLVDLLEDFCAPTPKDLNAQLPSALCEQCQQEFMAAYKFKRKMAFLLDFQIAFVKLKQSDPNPLRQLFDESHDYMNLQFQELSLIEPEHTLCWDDLECTEAEAKEVNPETVGNVEVIMNDETDETEPHVFHIELLEDSSSECLSDNSANIEVEYLEFEQEAEDQTMIVEEPESSPGERRSPASKVKYEKPLSCDKCRFSTYYKDTFEYHKQKHVEQETQTEWKCGINDCEEQFDWKDLLVRHKREVHQCCVCDICGVVLKNKYSLDVHVRRHKGETRFTCKYCPSTFYTAQEHKLHLGLVHVTSERVKCGICGLEFKNATCLKRHLKSHSEIRSYQCPFCEKAFKTTMHLHRHKETIHLKVRFNCDYCDTSYGRKDKLRMHIERVHNIQTYFLCDICLKSFSTEDQRQEHMGHHANPKPLECAICLVAFLTQDEFDKHLCISYRKDYVCCERDFKFHSFYNKHTFLVHGLRTNARVKPAVNKLIANVRAERKQEERCAKCERTFTTRKQKNAHRKVCRGKQ
ncbi:zinc finger protein 62-like [Ochlerotatus camptorhynchus]|uniref:zinc finger protein 62-like n=1 Tax=Ochlerotatus camptorhynchus TaxID=644619 RepID=UPI0031DE3A90